MNKSMTMVNIFAGMFLGLFIGFLLGLSLSEIVGSIAAILVSASVVFMGFSENRQSTSSDTNNNDRAKLVRTLCQSIFCILGVLFGIYTRTHNYLGVSPIHREYAELMDMGFSQSEAKDLIKQQFVKNASIDALTIKASTGGLYNNLSKTEVGDIDPSNYPDLQKLLTAFRNQNSDLRAFVDFVEANFDQNDIRNVLQYHWNYLMKTAK